MRAHPTDRATLSFCARSLTGRLLFHRGHPRPVRMPEGTSFGRPVSSLCCCICTSTDRRLRTCKGRDRAKPSYFPGFRAGRLNLAERPGRQRHHSHPPAHSVLAGTGRAPITHGPPQREWVGLFRLAAHSSCSGGLELLALDQASCSVL